MLKHQPNGMNSGHQPNGINPQRQQNGVISSTRHTPNGINPQRQQNGVISSNRHTPNGINPQHQQNGIISNTRHTPNGTSSQHERGETNLEQQQSQSEPRGRAPMPLQLDFTEEDDYPVTAIRVPVGVDERSHYVDIDIRTCALPGCGCRWPDLRRFLGEHETWDVDYQVFRALWEPPGMESLHGTYILFTMKDPMADNRLHLQWNAHFPARLKGDVFILKVKEPIDPRGAFTDPLGYPVRTLPHQSGVINARYEHIGRSFFRSDLFSEMTLAATHPDTRVTNPNSTQLPIPVGFWRAFVQDRVRLHDYQVPPVTPAMGYIMARFLPPHPSFPPWVVVGRSALH